MFILQLYWLKQIIKCYSRWPGRCHDARVWFNSPLFDRIADLCHSDERRLDETYHIIGDSAYPLSNNLMTPYRGNRNSLPAWKQKYNTHLCSKRSSVERSFALLVLRFPRLLKLTCKTNYKRILCVVAACFLHNWCLIEDDEDTDVFDYVEGLEMDGHIGIPAAAIIGNRRARGPGSHKRDMMAAIINNLP